MDTATKKKQSDYLVLFETNTDSAASRMEKYEGRYQKQFFGGAKNKNTYMFKHKNTYTFDDRSTQTIKISQTGGTTIDIIKNQKELEKSKKNVEDTITKINTIENTFKKQNESYFENENFLDVDGLRQRNQFLIEMMNIIILHNFLIGQTSVENAEFTGKIKDKITTFKKNLSDIWKVMKSTVEGDMDNPVISKLVANNIVTISEIQQLYSAYGLEPTTTDIKDDELINRATHIKLLSGFVEKFGLSNMSVVANNLQKIYSTTPVSLSDKSKSIDDLYNNMFNFYTTLTSTNTALVTTYNKLLSESLDMKSISEFTGNIIEQNIITVNQFIKEIIITLQNFSINLNLLQLLQQEFLQSDRRLNDFKTYMKEVTHQLLPKKDIVGDEHTDLFSSIDPKIVISRHNMGTDPFTFFYAFFIERYGEKLMNAANNITNHYNYNKEIISLDDKIYMFYREKIEFEIIAPAIFNWDFDGKYLERPIDEGERPIGAAVSTDFDNQYLGRYIDVREDFTALSNTIAYAWIPYLRSLTPIFVFPNIKKRINIPAIIDALLDRFVSPDPDKLKLMVSKYAGVTGHAKIPTPVEGMTLAEQYKLANDVLTNYVKYIDFAKSYHKKTNPIYIVSMYKDNEYDKYITKAIELQIDINNNKDKFDGLRFFCDFIQNVTNDFDNDRIRADITTFLDSLLKMSGYNTHNGAEAMKIKDDIVNQWKVTLSSLFDLFYEDLARFYYLSNNLIVINSAKNPNFAKIQQDQRSVSKLIVETKKIKLVPNIRNLELAADEYIYIYPPVTEYTAPDTDTWFIDKDYNAKQYDDMNRISAGNPLFTLLQADTRKNSIFSGVKREYYTFFSDASILLSFMNELLNNGTSIVNPGGDYYAFDEVIANGDDRLYTSPFEYDTSKITYPPEDDVSKIFRKMESVDSVVLKDDALPNLNVDIPDYVKDNINIVSGNLQYTMDTSSAENSIEIKIVNWPRITVTHGANVTAQNISDLRDIINTGKYIIDFMDQLLGIVYMFKGDMHVETPTTWDTPMLDETTKIYGDRNNKKTKLLSALNILEKIETAIKNNKGVVFLNTVLLPSTVILNARILVQNADPGDASFNATVDKIWIFARTLVVGWYSIFGHILTGMILINTVRNVTVFIMMFMAAELDPGNVLRLDAFKPFMAKIVPYFNLVDRELEKRKHIILGEQSNYPINTDPAKQDTIRPAANKYVIPPDIINIIEYDSYYTNIGTKSEKIYILMALIKYNKKTQFQRYLVGIQTGSDELVDLIESFEPFLANAQNRFAGRTVYPDDDNYVDVINILSEMDVLVDTITEELQNLLNRIKMSQLYSDIMGYINNYSDAVKRIDYDAKLDQEDPRGILNRMLRPNRFTHAILLTYHPNMERQYRFVMIQCTESHNPTLLMRLVYTDIYSIIFKCVRRHVHTNIKPRIDECILTINITYFHIQQAFTAYYEKHIGFVETVFSSTFELTDIDTTGATIDNANTDAMRFILFSPQLPDKKKLIDEISGFIKNVTTKIQYNLFTTYQDETNNYKKLIDEEISLRKSISRHKIYVQEKTQKLKTIVDTISEVMFSDSYKNYPFVDNTKLLTYVSDVIDNFEAIIKMIENKVYSLVSKNNHHILTLSQINNYNAFKAAINKIINNSPTITKYYKKISFGVIEYYYDVIYTIVQCLESKPFDNMSDVESYLYQHHYIQLKRCCALFDWLRHDYFYQKLAEDAINKSTSPPGKKFYTILNKKIVTLMTTGDVNRVFQEFHGIRRYLDEYSTTIMDKVQLHLRINDFVDTDYNKKIDRLGIDSGRDLSFVKDTAPDSEDYLTRWDDKELIFINYDNNLKINFGLLSRIDDIRNSGEEKPYNLYYSAVYNRMNPIATAPGIDFERIYNSIVYPDSDVISNYMSIAPNILNNKGTVLMTYGYSGVGKSASLFGQQANPELGILATNGILQATMEQFTHDIYFRVFEIYGLGTQYNYYWNPTDVGDSRECYPDFYQCIIHHVINNSDPNVLTISDQLIFTNRHDMFAYILDLKDPARSGMPGFKVNNIQDPNLAGKKGYGTYFDASDQMINSTYVKITQNHYRNFSMFSKGSLENSRENIGIEIKRLFSHIIKQVKGTLNNPTSSRSILVYDFEINTTPGSSDPIYVPFLIYDLPGKEDIAGTYVDPSDNDYPLPEFKNERKRLVKNIRGDGSKIRKSSYILNPLLLPIFGNNNEEIIDILTSLSSSGVGYGGVKMDANVELTIVTEIYGYEITNFNWLRVADPDTPGGTIGSYQEFGGYYPVSDFYAGAAPATFIELFDETRFDTDLYSSPDAVFNVLVNNMGIIAVDPSYKSEGATKINTIMILKELKILIAIITIAHLIKYKYFDLIVEIINIIVANGSDIEDNGGWSKNKIYEFFEAYYINENVVGLLQYLLDKVLKKTSTGGRQTIFEQDSINETIKDTINKNYSLANRYRMLINYDENQDPTIKIPELDNYDFKVKLSVISNGTEKDPLKQKETNAFISDYGVDASTGLYVEEDTTVGESLRRMGGVISFQNKSDYDSNKIFRAGTGPHSRCDAYPSGDDQLMNPRKILDAAEPVVINETNRPLLQDFIEPYEQKIAFYYLFYVVSNGRMKDKAEEQIKLLNNSMPFIDRMDPAKKKLVPE